MIIMRLSRCPCLSESIGDAVFAKAAIKKKDEWVYAAWEWSAHRIVSSMA
jgi:hypothetical protein